MEEKVNMITALLLSIRKYYSEEHYSVTKIFEQLKMTELSEEAIFEILKYMENEGLAEVNYEFDDAFIKLTKKGIIEFGKKPATELGKIYMKFINLGLENNFEAGIGKE